MRFLLTRGRGAFLAALAILLALAAAGALRVRIDASNRSMHAERPEETAVEHELREAFGARDEILIAIAHPDPLGADGLALLARLTDEIAATPGVARATSLANAMEVRAGERGVELVPLLDAAPTRASVDAALARNVFFEGLLVSRDRRATAIVVEIEDVEGEPFHDLVAALRALQARETRGAVEVHATGLPLQKHDVARLVDRDQRRLVPLCLVVLAALLGLVFRRISGVILPLAATGASLVVTIGAYGWSGLALNPITSLLPPVVLVLSVTTSVHLYRAWLAEDPADDGLERVLSVVRRLALPCFYATATTALGLASLALAETPAIRHFGLFAALGASVSYALAMTLVPLGLARLPPPVGRPTSARSTLLAALAEVTVRRPGAVVLAFAALTAAAALGIPRIVADTDLISFLAEGEPLVRDTRFVDRTLGGSNAIDVVVARRDGRPLERAEDVRRLARFADEVAALPGVAATLSLVPIAASVHRAATGGDDTTLPETDEELALVLDLLAAGDDPGLLRQVLDPTFSKLRVRLVVRAIGSTAAANLVERVLEAGRETLGPDLRVSAGGAFVRFALDSNRIVETQVETFALAFGLVFALIGVLLRSAGRLAIAVVPNVVPIVWTGGIMGFAGIELSTGTAMIACVVLGLVVDDTIHYLVRFGREREGGASAVEAVRRTTPTLGVSLAISSLVLAAGFAVGALGSFRPAIQFSVLTAITMTTALAADLLLLPALLVLGERGRRPRAADAVTAMLVIAALATSVEGGDEILRRVLVPSPARPQGEVRIVRRDGDAVVQVVLWSRLLRRVGAEIRAKEERNWPDPASPEGEAARRYVAELENAIAGTIAAAPPRAPGAAAKGLAPSGKLGLVIELSSDAATFLAADVAAGAEGLVPRNARELRRLPLPTSYAERNLRLVVADSFDLSEEDAARALAPQ